MKSSGPQLPFFLPTIFHLQTIKGSDFIILSSVTVRSRWTTTTMTKKLSLSLRKGTEPIHDDILEYHHENIRNFLSDPFLTTNSVVYQYQRDLTPGLFIFYSLLKNGIYYRL